MMSAKAVDWRKRFWRYVRKTRGCWLWTGALLEKRYGATSRDGRPARAHRLAWEWHHGPIPRGKMVLHHCDQPQCVRPSHLYLGDKFDNARDAVRRGRQVKGETVGTARLTAEDVRTIRKEFAAGVKATDLAARFGIGPGYVRDLARRLWWRHVS